jgi:hypothetical protein
MSIFPPINLPWPILVHALGLTFVGLKLIVFPNPSGPPKRAEESTRVMLGIATTGLGLAYLTTSYMPTHSNQFLYASVPVRMILGGIAGIKLLASMAGKGSGLGALGGLWFVTLYDGMGGFLLGWWLGSWSGRAPGL